MINRTKREHGVLPVVRYIRQRAHQPESKCTHKQIKHPRRRPSDHTSANGQSAALPAQPQTQLRTQSESDRAAKQAATRNVHLRSETESASNRQDGLNTLATQAVNRWREHEGETSDGRGATTSDKAAARANRPRSDQKVRVARAHARTATKCAPWKRCPKGNHPVQSQKRNTHARPNGRTWRALSQVERTLRPIPTNRDETWINACQTRNNPHRERGGRTVCAPNAGRENAVSSPNRPPTPLPSH